MCGCRLAFKLRLNIEIIFAVELNIRVMDQIINFIQNSESNIFTVSSFLWSAFIFILGIICAEYRIEEWFHHRRIWKRLAVCLAILIVAIALNWHVIAAGIFTFLVIISTFLPLPHEVILLRYYKTHEDALEKERYRCWLVTTTALLRFYELKIRKSRGLIKRQDVQIAFIDEAKKWDLFDREYIKYYLPNLDVLFRIGTIKAFENECSKLSRFDNTGYMLSFKTYLAHNNFDYEKMEELESKCPDTDDESRLVSLINKYCAYEASGEKEKMKNVISKLLELKRKGIIHVELYRDLMRYYDEIIADKEAADTLAEEIEKINLACFGDYLNLLDIAFMHYRINGNQQKTNSLIERIIAENKKRQQGDEQMITQIKLMYVMFDNGYKWQEYSVGLFLNRTNFLNRGYRVGAVFIQETYRLLRDVSLLNNQSLNNQLQNEMFADFDRYIERYISEIESDIAELDDRFLYRKRNLLMLKLELLKNKVGDDLVLLRKNNDEIFDRLIEMCRHNGDKREMLHFLVVHADDILTIDNQIRESGKDDVGYANTMLQKDYDNHRMAYINKAENLVCEIVNMLYLRKYDKSLAYYVIYTAYFYMLLENRQRCLFFFTMFEKYDIDIRNWTIAIQQQYKKVQNYVSIE